MELGTIFTIILWIFGLALAAPFVMIGLVFLGLIIVGAVWLFIMAIGIIYYVGLGIYNLIGWPLGFGFFHESKSNAENDGDISNLSVADLEKGAAPCDLGYVCCDEWMDWVKKVETETVGEN